MNRKFPLTHVFGVTRKEYYRLTGITPIDLVRFYEAENMAMVMQRNNVRKWLRKVPYASPKGRYLQELFIHITVKIDKNRRKIRQIKSEDC
jgi:hypothetical protein